MNRRVQMDCQRPKRTSRVTTDTLVPMRSLMLMTVLLAAEAGAVCTPNLCQCRPAEFTAVGVLHSDGRLTLEDVRWADGGVGAVDAGRFFTTNVDLDVVADVPVVVGGERSATVLPLEAWKLTDAGLVMCQGGTASLAEWRDALSRGTCADLAPQPRGPCNDTRPCSTTAGLSLLATVALLALRSTRRSRR